MKGWNRALLCAACGCWLAFHVVMLWTTQQGHACEMQQAFSCRLSAALREGLAVSGGLLMLVPAALAAWGWHHWLQLSHRGCPTRPDGIASCAALLGVLGLSGLGIGLWLVFGSHGFTRHGSDDVVTQVALLIGSGAMGVLAWGVWRWHRWGRVGAVPALLWPLAAAASLGGDAAGPLVMLFYALPFFCVTFYLSMGHVADLR